MIRTRSTVAVACACVCVAVLGGCSSDGGSRGAGKKPHPPSTSSSTAAPNGSSTSTPTPSHTGIASNRLPAVGLGVASPLAPKVLVTVSKLEPTTLSAHGPGQTAGSGVLATVTVRNDSGRPFDLNGIAINAHYADGTPATPNEAPPARRLDGVLASGAQATGVYAFRLPPSGDGSVVLDVQQNASPNVVIVDAGT